MVVRFKLSQRWFAGKGTEITLTHSNLPDEKWRKQHEEGWVQLLATLDDLGP